MQDKIKPVIEFLDSNEYKRDKLYILGNCSLYLQGLRKEEPKDYDILIYDGDRFDVDMPSGRVDGILFHLALLPKDFSTRAKLYFEYKGVKIYLLDIADIIINKISGYHMIKHRNSIINDISKAGKDVVFGLLADIKQQEFTPVREGVFRQNIRDFEYDNSVTSITRAFRAVKNFLTPEKKNVIDET